MSTSKWLAASLIAVLVIGLTATAVQAKQGGPGEPNRGETQPAHQGHRWGDPAPEQPNPVNPPVGGQPAAKVAADETATLVVVVWGDSNANGVWDSQEVVLESVYVALESKNGTPIRFQKTGEDGQVEFLDLVQGEYVLDVRPQAGWSPALIPVTVVAGETTEVEVGLRPISTGG